MPIETDLFNFNIVRKNGDAFTYASVEERMGIFELALKELGYSKRIRGVSLSTQVGTASDISTTVAPTGNVNIDLSLALSKKITYANAFYLNPEGLPAVVEAFMAQSENPIANGALTLTYSDRAILELVAPTFKKYAPSDLSIAVSEIGDLCTMRAL
jgi:hypothetical protein